MPRADSEKELFKNNFIMLNFCNDGKLIFLSDACHVNILPKEQAQLVIERLSNFYSLPTEDINNFRKQLSDELTRAMTASCSSIKKQKNPPQPGFIYFLLIERNYIKIGYTNHISRRLEELSPKLHTKPALLGYLKVTDTKHAEILLHEFFSHKREHGEWFRLTPKQLSKIKFPVKITNLILEDKRVLKNA